MQLWFFVCSVIFLICKLLYSCSFMHTVCSYQYVIFLKKHDVHGCSLSTLRFPVYGLLTTLLLYESGPQVLGRGCLRRRWLSWFDFGTCPISH